MDEYIKKKDVLKLLNRNSITKKITLADGISIYDSVKNLPTADVVPKSEVEKMFAEILNIIRVYEFDSLTAKNNYGVFQVRNFGADILKLKKKYTDCDPSPAPEEKYFSPQQVRDMSPQELHDNFEAIRKSMELWQI